jgi:flagellar hook-length control protein FliK
VVNVAAQVVASTTTTKQSAAAAVATSPQATLPTNAATAATAANSANATDASLAATIAAPTPLDPKTGTTKDAGTAQPKTTGLVSSAGTTTADTSTQTTTNTPAFNTTAPQPTAADKPDIGAAITPVAAKADDPKGAPSASTAAPSSRDNVSAVANATTAVATPDINAQAALSAAPQPGSPVPALSTANLTATAAPSAAVPLSGLAVEIAASARSGKTSFDVRLDPADLGRIDVRIDVDRNGQVTSHLTVEKPETLAMLQQDAPQLRQSLDDAGLKTGSGGLQFSLRDQSSSNQNSQQSSGNAQRLVISEDDQVPAAVAGRSYGRMLTSNGGVDIRV